MAARLLPIAAIIPAVSAVAQTTDQRQPTLDERLLAGLQTRRPSERAFVEAVVDTVGRGELSEDLVDRVFFWSRDRASRRSGRRPIVYFQPALERLAARGRVTIRTDSQAVAAGG